MSTSLIHNRRHSSNRIPLPYNSPAISRQDPSSIVSKRATSSTESITGIRRGRLARTRCSIQGKSTTRTSR